MAKRVLVTGATGFLGSHVTKQLLQRNFKVVGTSRCAHKGKALEELLDSKNLELHSGADMGENPACYSRLID
jgi:nucleoside-diphosphate-sugar epimerase